MKLWDCFSTALRALLSNKLRSALTMLGILIGVAAVISVLSLGSAQSAIVEESFASLNCDQGHRISPVVLFGIQIAGAMDAGMDMDISFGAFSVPDPAVAAGRAGNEFTAFGVDFTARIVGHGDMRCFAEAVRHPDLLGGEKGVIGRHQHTGRRDKTIGTKGIDFNGDRLSRVNNAGGLGDGKDL